MPRGEEGGRPPPAPRRPSAAPPPAQPRPAPRQRPPRQRPPQRGTEALWRRWLRARCGASGRRRARPAAGTRRRPPPAQRRSWRQSLRCRSARAAVYVSVPSYATCAGGRGCPALRAELRARPSPAQGRPVVRGRARRKDPADELGVLAAGRSLRKMSSCFLTAAVWWHEQDAAAGLGPLCAAPRMGHLARRGSYLCAGLGW